VTVAVAFDVVVLELPAEHAEQAQAAVGSCELVLGKGHCRTSGEPGPTASWYATVVWQDDSSLDATVELRSSESGPTVSVREVRFEEADSLEQRYRALGLLVVSHVLASKPQPTATAASQISNEAPLPTEPAPDYPPAPLPLLPLTLGVDLAGAVGPAIASGQLRWGGNVRGWVAVTPSAPRPQVSLGFSRASSEADVTWYSGSVGVAAPLDIPELPVSFELHLEAILQRMQLVADNGDARESAGQTRGGMGLGGDAFVGLSDQVAVMVGGSATFLAPNVRLTVGEDREGTLRAPTWAAQVGVRLIR
jgi:hypothetical protein